MIEANFIVAFLIGLVAHLLATLLEDSKKIGRRIELKEFSRLHPYQISLSLVFSIAAYMMFFKMNELNMVSAFAAGYMGDSMVKKVMSGVKLK